MTDIFTPTLIIAYSVYGFFSFMQKRHMARFEGASQAFLGILTLFVAVTTITNIGLLIYFGISTTWWAPVILFIVGFLAFCAIAVIPVRFPEWVMSLIGFILVPIALLIMWIEMKQLVQALQA